jgi:hypothetical protein
MTSGGARPRESCASGGRQGAGVVQAALASGGGVIGGEAGQATRQGREAQRGHWATMGEGVC